MINIFKLRKRYLFLWTTVILIAGSVIFYKPIYKLFYPDYTYRYRLTVEIDTPDGVKSGSSVIEVYTIQWPKWSQHLFAGNYSQSFAKGEAVFVDLGNGKNIVALLTHGHYAESTSIKRLAPRSFFKDMRASSKSPELSEKLSEMTGEVRELTGSLTPTIATFDNPNDPESLNIVYAVEIYNKKRKNYITLDTMKSKLGKGFKFKSAKIQLTNDPVTNTLGNHLPWSDNAAKVYKAWKKIVSDPPKNKRFHFLNVFRSDELLQYKKF